MKRVLQYDVQNKPSKERLGRTNIFERRFDEETGEVSQDIPLGFLTKTRSGPYVAIAVLDDREVTVGDYDTRSKGAHAIRKEHGI